jgi:hypothetical protein
MARSINTLDSLRSYSDPKSFVNFLLPPREFGEGWGGVKNLRLLQGLLYRFRLDGNDKVKVNNFTFPQEPLPTDHSP